MMLPSLCRRIFVSLFLVVACSSEDAPPGPDESDAPDDVPAETADPAPPAPEKPAASEPAFAVSDAMARAQSGVGFSYWWGGGCWRPGDSGKGSCSGSCPSCSHTGSWGADCSGYVAKVWQVPKPSDVQSCSHPYSTDTFYNQEHGWKTVPRSEAKAADAFVYRKDSAGHMFLFDSGDAWGWIKAYEAKGCSYGIVYASRTASTAYKVIRKTGF